MSAMHFSDTTPPRGWSVPKIVVLVTARAGRCWIASVVDDSAAVCNLLDAQSAT